MSDSRVEGLRRRLEREPESRAFAQLAEELRRGGEAREAADVARAGLEIHPNYASARLTLGRALLDSGDAAGARAELERTLDEAPDNILASRLLGEALEAVGDVESAVARYSRTLEMAPGDAHVEGRLRAIQQRGEGQAHGSDATKPMPAVRRGEVGEAAAAGGGVGTGPRAVERLMPAEGASDARAQAPLAGGAEGVRIRGRADESPGPALARGGVARQTGRAEARVGGGASTGEASGAVGGVAPRVGRAIPEMGEGAEEFVEMRPGDVEGGDRPGPDGARISERTAVENPGQRALSSVTLAELYFQQGLLEKAMAVYVQVLEEEPSNAAARRRLGEIERVRRERVGELPVRAPEGGDERAARRRGVKMAIERLEELLVVVRRR